jgi:hypothetical protein
LVRFGQKWRLSKSRGLSDSPADAISFPSLGKDGFGIAVTGRKGTDYELREELALFGSDLWQIIPDQTAKFLDKKILFQ